MRKLIGITDATAQQFTLLIPDGEVTFTIYYGSVVESWFFDVSYMGRTTRGVRIAVGTPHLLSQNYPFDFVAQDESKKGVDPFRRSDFVEGRTTLYILSAQEVQQIKSGSRS